MSSQLLSVVTKVYVLEGAIEATSPEETLAQFNTNVFGLLNVTRAFLPHMRARRSGAIAMMSSGGGWKGFPGVGLYCATKFAIEGIAEGWGGTAGHNSYNHRAGPLPHGTTRGIPT